VPAHSGQPASGPAHEIGDRKPAPRARRGRAQTMAAVLACALSATACAAGTAAAHQPGPAAHQANPASVALPQIPASRREHVPSALYGTVVYGPATPGLPRPLVNPANIIPGGPAPDGIPAIDHPRFLRAAQVSFLSASEPVLALQIGADARAYPVQILIWHEIVNDTVGGVPVAVTYCPLCNSAIAYDRHAAGRVLSFGTSGRLFDSNLVMYDRQTQSLWVQFTGQAVAGVLTGRTLRPYPMQTVAWGTWRAGHQHGWVLSRDTGYSRPYGQNPYPGYDNINSQPFLFSGRVNGRYTAMTRLVGMRSGTDAVAVLLSALKRRQVIDLTLAGRPVVVWWQPGTGSPLSSATIAGGPDIGTTGAFSPVVGSKRLHFLAVAEGFRDRETGSRWSVLGLADTGPLAGQNLTPVTHEDTFWFVWAAFRPHTRVVS
jgi:Protein of unknown function (DUF3179)